MSAKSGIHRTPRPETGYTTISNDIIRHPEMTWETRMVLIYILSMPDNYTTTQKRLNEMYPRGRRFYQRCIDEMRRFGYAGRKPRPAGKGRWEGQNYSIYDVSQPGLIKEYWAEQQKKEARKQKRRAKAGESP